MSNPILDGNSVQVSFDVFEIVKKFTGSLGIGTYNKQQLSILETAYLTAKTELENSENNSLSSEELAAQKVADELLNEKRKFTIAQFYKLTHGEQVNFNVIPDLAMDMNRSQFIGEQPELQQFYTTWKNKFSGKNFPYRQEMTNPNFALYVHAPLLREPTKNFEKLTRIKDESINKNIAFSYYDKKGNLCGFSIAIVKGYPDLSSIVLSKKLDKSPKEIELYVYDEAQSGSLLQLQEDLNSDTIAYLLFEKAKIFEWENKEYRVNFDNLAKFEENFTHKNLDNNIYVPFFDTSSLTDTAKAYFSLSDRSSYSDDEEYSTGSADSDGEFLLTPESSSGHSSPRTPRSPRSRNDESSTDDLQADVYTLSKKIRNDLHASFIKIAELRDKYYPTPECSFEEEETKSKSQISNRKCYLRMAAVGVIGFGALTSFGIGVAVGACLGAALLAPLLVPVVATGAVGLGALIGAGTVATVIGVPVAAGYMAYKGLKVAENLTHRYGKWNAARKAAHRSEPLYRKPLDLNESPRRQQAPSRLLCRAD